MTPNVGLLLSGCGRRDGTEIHEAVAALLSLQQRGASVQFISIDRDQARVVDHLTGQLLDERRNMLSESGRIARRQVTEIRQVESGDLDALIVPGGYGAVLSLSNFQRAKEAAEIDPEVARLIRGMREERKPIGGICFGSMLIGLALKSRVRARLACGDNPELEAALSTWGHAPVRCGFEEVVADEASSVFSTPAYLHDRSLADIFRGIDALVARILG